MKVHFDNHVAGSRSGPNTFASRLKAELERQGHDVVRRGDDAEVSLVFIEPTGARLAKTVVQRLDGFWFKPQDFHRLNKNIRWQYEHADGVVFQSDFNAAMVKRWFGPPHGCWDVIRNGIDLTPTPALDHVQVKKLRQKYDVIFVSSANWHPQKRLRSNVELFFHLRKSLNLNCCLVVMGSNPDYVVNDPDVMYVGSLPWEVCREVYRAADWMLHLSWLDHAPNVVVEALSMSVPVICSSQGGVKEQIGSYGIVLKETRDYDLELVDYDQPPNVDVSQLTTLPKRSMLAADFPSIDIEKIAKDYVDFMQKATK